MKRIEVPVAGLSGERSAAVREWLKRGTWRLLRGILSWTSLLAIPLGIGVGLNGYMTLGALLVLGGTLAYFLVDPIMLLLDLKPSERSDQEPGGRRERSP